MRKIYSFLTAIALAITVSGQIKMEQKNSSYSQDFNSLASTGSSSILPSGWALNETGTSGDSNYTADNGATNSGNTYSYGITSSSERALGSLLSGNVKPSFGASFKNDTGSKIKSVKITYTGETWRVGTINRIDRLDFSYSKSATNLSSSDYTNYDALDYEIPNTLAPISGTSNFGTLRHSANISSTIVIDIAVNEILWIKWTDFDASGADDGLSIDDFSIEWTNELEQCTAPVITTQLSTQTVTAGNTATFTVAATGDNLTYQWYVNKIDGIPSKADNWQLIDGATSASFTTAATTMSMTNYLYKVVVSSGTCSTASETALLMVNEACTAPVITTQPSTQTVTEGITATFTVAATGDNLTYQWQVDTGGSRKGAYAWEDIAGATSVSYTTASTALAMNGYVYRVVVSSRTCSTASDVSILTVKEACTAPVITTQPVGVRVIKGNTATFTVAATGTNLTYQWYVNKVDGVPVKINLWELIDGATSASYTTAATTASMTNYLYKVVVSSGDCNTTSDMARLTVENCTVPVITTQPSAQSITEGNTATFSVVATGEDLGYQWQVYNEELSDWINLDEEEDGTGYFTATYTTPELPIEASGDKFRVIVISNTFCYVISEEVVLTVTESLSVGDVNATKVNLVKNTIVANELVFAVNANVAIYNATGQIVKTAEVKENSRLDVSSLAKGTYVVTGTVNGKAVSAKFIKK